MALIYASAVNKRMNAAPRQKRSLVEGSNCMETSYTSHYRQRSNEDRIVGHSNGAFEVPVARERNQRKRSTSQNSGTNSSCACTPPPTSALDGSTENLRSSMHQSIHRSKTSAADVNRKLTVVQINHSKPAMRKISSPIMSQSVIYEPTFKQHSSMKNNLRKALAKKRMGGKESHVYKEELAQLAVSDSDHTEDEETTPITKQETKRRRRSLSLDASNDPDSQKNGEKRTSSSSTTKAPTAFRKMCERFNKWKLNTHVVQN